MIGLRAAQVGNTELKWETSTQTNVGIDYGFMEGRVTGALEFYQKVIERHAGRR